LANVLSEVPRLQGLEPSNLVIRRIGPLQAKVEFLERFAALYGEVEEP
jgi:hypothetical protein